MQDYYGQTMTGSYFSAPRMGTGATFLPPLESTMQASYKSYAPPFIVSQSLNLPWKPSVYYRGANKLSPLSQSAPVANPSILMRDDAVYRVPPMLPSNRTALFSKYTPTEWFKSNNTNYRTSDFTRSAAQRLRDENVRIAHDTDAKTFKNQHESSKNLGQRMSDINFWKSELHKEIDEMQKEINDVAAWKQRTEHALRETEGPLAIAQECLFNREKRQGIDLVNDAVEKELLKEVDTIKRSQDQLRKMIDRQSAQLSMNRAALHELEKDTADKWRSLNIDGKCHQLHNNSEGLAYFRGVEGVDNTVSVPESWAKFTNDNLLRSQRERNASRGLRGDVDSVLQETANDMWTQYNTSNVAFQGRVAETLDARNNIQAHLAKVLQEINEMENNISMMRKALQDKNAPLQVAQSRLDSRTRRPNVELCRDQPQHRLVREVSEIYETVDILQNRLRAGEAALQELVRTKTTLEHDLSVKNNSLFIDKEKCMGVRRTYPTTTKLAAYRQGP
ncbi:tektin-3-like [Saccoglossus kowalevskii]|uniref:Tektin n=1 Tax=Saccoglossus kowalevskii TaxID=10224 RepID=A0ABM0GKU6_SACKO|nr:PREDICTED: tektin-3-like [Saccoglossus kowalevskii]